MNSGYFHRVTRDTPTRFWINNPSLEEVELAIDAGAIACTTNPIYCAKLLQVEPEYLIGLIDQSVANFQDDEIAADAVCQSATTRLLNRYLPIFERSKGQQGFVTIQSDPRKDEDADELINSALRYRTLGPNFMAKIPVTEAGLTAMEMMIEEGIPICMTEVFAIDQVIAACELYERVTAKTRREVPFYLTHITGIFDEYISQVVAQEGVNISPEVLAVAGSTVGRREYRLIQERGWKAVLLGGGARSISHFTDFVGGNVHVTINWSTAQELVSLDEQVESRIDVVAPLEVVNELRDKLSDFRLAYDEGTLPVEEFGHFGPVLLFRNRFIAGYEQLLAGVASRRKLSSTSAM